MTTESSQYRPQDERLFLYSLAFRAAQLPLLKHIIVIVDHILLSLSPRIPDYLNTSDPNDKDKGVILTSALIGFFFCTIITTILSFLDGTLYGVDSGRRYLITDWPNIINYTVLCPLYVGYSVKIIVLTIRGYNHTYSIEYNPGTREFIPKQKLSIVIVIIILISVFLTISYLHESVKSETYDKVGWWIKTYDDHGAKVLGNIGVYYTLLNFGLLSVCLTALFSFISMYYLTMRVGKMLSDESVSSKIQFKDIQHVLKYFVQIYISTKLLTGVLMLNAYTWKFERPENSFNIIIMGMALAVLGVFFVSIPRYYVEYEWFKFKVRRDVANGLDPDLTKDNLRTLSVSVTAHILDALIISGFIFTFFTWNP